MLDAIGGGTGGGMDVGALGTAFNDSRGQKAREKAEAIRQGRSVQGQGDLEAKVRGVAEEFVSVFMNQVMKSMRATVPENPEMHGDNGEKFFQEMLDTEQSKYLAKGSGYGLTDLIYQSLMSSHRVAEPAADQQAAIETEAEAEAYPAIEDTTPVEAIG